MATRISEEIVLADCRATVLKYQHAADFAVSWRRNIGTWEVRSAMASSPERMLELFFSQSLDGFFFMMLDKPIRWDDSTDKESVLDYVFEHQRMTKINDAMLGQYGASADQFLGRTPADL